MSYYWLPLFLAGLVALPFLGHRLQEWEHRTLGPDEEFSKIYGD